MVTPDEHAFFLEHGYLHVKSALEGEHLALIQSEFDRVWELEKPPVTQHKLLKHRAFIDLISHAPILALSCPLSLAERGGIGEKYSVATAPLWKPTVLAVKSRRRRLFQGQNRPFLSGFGWQNV